MRRTRLLLIAALALLLLAITPAVAGDVSATLTGCIQKDKGVLYYVAAGDSPMRPCEDGDRQVSFNMTGPQGPPGAAAPAPKVYGYVGLTSLRFNGGVGWLAMSQACAAQYPGGRMAFSDELRVTPNPPAIPESAWILHRGPVGGDESGNRWPAAEGPGDCTTWTDGTDHATGIVVLPGGDFTFRFCYTVLPVACTGILP